MARMNLTVDERKELRSCLEQFTPTGPKFVVKKGPMMTPYPTTFPLDSAKLILARLTGKAVPLADLASAEWELQGFVFSQVFSGAQPVVWTVADPGEDSMLELQDELQGYCDAVGSGAVTAAGAVDWMKWLQLILKFLPLFLKDKP